MKRSLPEDCWIFAICRRHLTISPVGTEPVLSNFGHIYRFAPGGLTKRAMRYNEKYFYETMVLSINEDGLTEKLLIPRASV